MLHADLDISPLSQFFKQIKDDKLSSCFWILDAHGDNLSKIDILNISERFIPVVVVEQFKANAVLFRDRD